MAYASRQEPSAPPMYPTESIRPLPLVRSDLPRDPQEQTLLPSPRPPPRSDKPPVPPRNDNEENTGNDDYDCACNYNRYATRKTMGHFALIAALFMSNVFHLRTLISQKQHDGVWVASLALVCGSILIQLGLAALLYFLFKDDIRNPQRQSKLERLNTLAFVIIIVISALNFAINILMLSINPQNFLDTHSIELLQQRNKQ